MKKIVIFFLLFFFALNSSAQKNLAWSEVNNSIEFTQGKLRREVLPTQYKLFTFDYEKFKLKSRDFLRLHEDKLAVAKLRTNKPITPTDLQELEIILLEHIFNC